MYIVTKQPCWINHILTVKSPVSIATSQGFKLTKK